MVEDDTLVVNAPGILSNDSDVEGDTLTVFQFGFASHGELNLFDDGSFSYTPDPDYSGSDQFYYHAFDGQEYSSLTEVIINVTPVNDPPVIVSTAPSTGTQGEEYLYAIEVDDPDDTIFNYLLFDAPNGISIDFNTGILTWTPLYGGDYRPINLRVQHYF